MNELAQALIAESYAAAPSHILEGLTDDLVHHELPNVPHTIYAELWHLTFWQQITLDWIAGIETPYPGKPSDGFQQSTSSESWEQLRYRFLHGAEQAAVATSQDPARLDHPIRWRVAHTSKLTHSRGAPFMHPHRMSGPFARKREPFFPSQYASSASMHPEKKKRTTSSPSVVTGGWPRHKWVPHSCSLIA